VPEKTFVSKIKLLEYYVTRSFIICALHLTVTFMKWRDWWYSWYAWEIWGSYSKRS